MPTRPYVWPYGAGEPRTGPCPPSCSLCLETGQPWGLVPASLRSSASLFVQEIPLCSQYLLTPEHHSQHYSCRQCPSGTSAPFTYFWRSSRAPFPHQDPRQDTQAHHLPWNNIGKLFGRPKRGGCMKGGFLSKANIWVHLCGEPERGRKRKGEGEGKRERGREMHASILWTVSWMHASLSSHTALFTCQSQDAFRASLPVSPR